MILSESSVNRLGIFFFYDKEGVVDDYVSTLLEGFKPFFSEMTIVVNGKLTSEGRAKLLHFTDEDKLIVRENKGFDAWAYKTALDSYGWEKLARFDEICLFNATIMGPVYPFSEMFEAMDQRDLDFWGITKFHRVPNDPFDRSPYGYLPEHIQSHFHAYRQSLVKSEEFQKYWDNLPEIKNYYDSVGLHESLFTKRFADKGFKWDVYVNTDSLEGFTYGPITFAAKQLVEEKRCPIFKRRSFFHPYGDSITQSAGNNALDLFEYLRDHTDYDTDLIWQNALRTMNLADLEKNLHLDFVLPQQTGVPLPEGKRIALVMHLYYMDLLDQTMSYATSMPEGCDIILTVGSEEKAETVRAYCEKHHLPYNIDIRIIENRGRDVSALLVGAGKDLLKYDYVCSMHDKKVTQVQPQSIGDGFRYKCFENNLATKEYVENIIHLFESNPRLGIAMPTPPNHGDYFAPYTLNWGLDFDGTKEFLENTLDVHVPLDEKEEAVAPLGTMFWFRPEALHGLLDHGWEYEDFPPEPNKTDATLLHYIERAYAYVAQYNGYFPAYIFSDRFARMEITNLAFEERELVRAISDKWLGRNVEVTKDNIKKGKGKAYHAVHFVRSSIKRTPLVGPLLVKLYRKWIRFRKA
ncbi:rhamnan synthesis F family protein [Bifidobacterium sp. ESL0790]|uniref:rhamnan synthesis F family protein n=1 Tax=Bifidobacterium sp. ESL0790 TaxID=2983233 RepID=UPI0023F7AE54|nr:rhamnan synthesis F family protein [Bifidobacterium sp. ESL0790]WEV72337.1 rhamnan synthesis F family protein [Bifidobacterium sp. ESL0790]